MLYFFRATNLISENNIENNLIKIKYKNFSLGKVAYEHTFRNFIKKSLKKKENFLFYISISKALFALKNYEKIFYNNNFLSFVLGELQYIPYRIFFNFATKKKIPIFAKLGGIEWKIFLQGFIEKQKMLIVSKVKFQRKW